MSSHKHVKLGTVNIENNPGLAARFFISRLPTLVHIKDHEGTKYKRLICSLLTVDGSSTCYASPQVRK